MRRQVLKSFIPAAVIVVTAAGAVAQDSTEQLSVPALSGGQIVVEPEITQYEDWETVCVTNDEGTKSCQLQHAIPNQGGGRVATIEIFNVPPGSGVVASAAIAVPLGVLLSDGLTLNVNDRPIRQYEFAICISDGCLARIGLQEALLNQLQAADNASFSITTGFNNETEIELDLSLAGFAEGFAALQETPFVAEGVPIDLDVAVGVEINEPEVTIFNDWARDCVVGPDDNRRCRLRQQVVSDNGTLLAAMIVFKENQDERFAAGAEILLPHGVSIENGLELQVDDALPRRYQFTTCLADGCLARIGVTQADLDRMKRGARMHVVFFAGADRSMQDFYVSLIGFTDAFESL